MATDDKARVKAAKNNYNLHVALIMRDGLSKADALVLAWSEGLGGLNIRLNSTGAPK